MKIKTTRAVLILAFKLKVIQEINITKNGQKANFKGLMKEFAQNVASVMAKSDMFYSLCCFPLHYQISPNLVFITDDFY